MSKQILNINWNNTDLDRLLLYTQSNDLELYLGVSDGLSNASFIELSLEDQIAIYNTIGKRLKDIKENSDNYKSRY